WMSNLQGSARGIIRKADTARDRRNWKVAARFYGLAFQKSPRRTDLLIQRGNCLKELGHVAEAFECYSHANRLAPSDDGYLQLGHVLKITGNLLAARRSYEIAAALGSTHATDECDGWRTLHPDAMSKFAMNRLTSQTIRVTNDTRRRVPSVGAARELAWCEHDPASSKQMRAAATRLFSLGYDALARQLVMMSRIRAGFAQATTAERTPIGSHRTATWSPNNVEDPVGIQSWRIAKKSLPAAVRALAQQLLNDRSFAAPP